MSDEIPRFRASTVKAILEQSISDHNDGKKIKVPQSTVEMVSEYLRYVVMEATERAADAAGADKVKDESHLEKILPQLLLDIS